jgi:inosose dehydratase
VLFEHVLDDISAAEYDGIEANDTAYQSFGRQPGRLRALLEEREIALAAGVYAAWYFDRQERKDEVERLRRLADFLAEAGGSPLMVLRTVPHPARRDMIAGEPPLLPPTPDRFDFLADSLNQACDICADFGIVGAFQNRVGTFVETPDEYQEVIERTDPELVRLAPDLGHWAYAGGDVASLLRTHRRRIVYPRLKDVRRAVFEKVRGERLGFSSFLYDAGFAELGEGDLHLEDALMPLVNAEYDGWLCVELERTALGPRESAVKSREFLRSRLHW